MKVDNDMQIINDMYKGEHRRDATSKLRGFLFQDLIAVDKLLEKETICICCEYIEDVMVLTQDKIQVIQAKYYPNSKLKKNEVIRELYYQYLRLNIKESSKKVIPLLAVYTNNTLPTVSISEMKSSKYIGIDREEEPKEKEDIDVWLDKNVYTEKKEDAQKKLFQKFAWNKSMEDFLKDYKEKNYLAICEYRRDIETKLGKLQFDDEEFEALDKEKRGSILLGLAVQYIHKKYDIEIDDNNDTFNNRKCERTKFLKYLKESIMADTDQMISAYLRAVVIEYCTLILENNEEMTDEQQDMLQCIANNTADWLEVLGESVLGQYSLVNTLSLNFKMSLEEFSKKTVGERRILIIERHDVFGTFFRYLWRIMMSINEGLLGKELSQKEKEYLNPQLYSVKTKEECICFLFPKEVARSVVILPELAKSSASECLTNIFERMSGPEPEKWYMSSKFSGRFRYDLNVSEIKKGNTVSTIGNKHFRIECMDCVNTDECWHKKEKYDNTLYKDGCIKGDMK